MSLFGTVKNAEAASPVRISWRITLIVLAGGFLAALVVVGWFVLHPRPRVCELPIASLFRRDELWYQIGHTNPFTGVLLEFYPDGAPLSRSAISNGQLNGLSEGWHTNRQAQIREHFRANISDGLRTKWHPNGNKLSEVTIVQGKIEGLFRRWREDGTLAEEIQMRDGKPDGNCRAYYESGFLKTESQMRNGQLIEQTSWKDGERRCQPVSELIQFPTDRGIQSGGRMSSAAEGRH